MKIEMVAFSEALAPHFGRLNRVWIERDYTIEPPDQEMLARPASVIERGGVIVFARQGDRVVGTGGLEPLGGGDFEIIKMAVEPDCQGQGIGQRLLAHLMEIAVARGATWVRIETASSLGPANALYRKNGFVPARVQRSWHGYSRADVFYEKRVR